jgi:hypothetical protein
MVSHHGPSIPGRASARNLRIRRIVERARTAARAKETAIGWVPYYASVDTSKPAKRRQLKTGQRVVRQAGGCLL